MNLKKYTKIKSTKVWMVSVFVISMFFTGCEFELPEANSKEDATPPLADFSGSLGDDYLSFKFSNFSVSSTDYQWEFGDGATSTDKNPEHIYSEMATDEEGTSYMVTLTASDKLGVTSVVTKEVVVKKPEKPILIKPDVKNGDFTGGTSDWKISNDYGGSTTPFNTSSDGSSLNYDGTDSGSSKTPGAKYTSGSSVEPRTNNSRNAYQAIAVSPNSEYILEYEYAIKTDKEDHPLGDQVVVEILDGWYDKTDDILASSLPPLVSAPGNVAAGKGNFQLSKTTFTTNDSGKIAIFIYAITKDELYIDNVKVYPAE